MGTLGQPKSNANANSEGHKYLNVANTIFISLLKVGSLMETKRYRQCNKIFHMEKCGNTAHTCKCKCHKKRDNWTVSCPLKGSASLMRCEAVCECVCSYKNMSEHRKAFHSRALMHSDTFI